MSDMAKAKIRFSIPKEIYGAGVANWISDLIVVPLDLTDPATIFHFEVQGNAKTVLYKGADQKRKDKEGHIFHQATVRSKVRPAGTTQAQISLYFTKTGDAIQMHPVF